MRSLAQTFVHRWIRRLVGDGSGALGLLRIFLLLRVLRRELRLFAVYTVSLKPYM